MAQPQLTLIQGAHTSIHARTEKTAGSIEWQAPGLHPQSADPVRRIFEHWVELNGRLIRRCKLGPDRRAAITGALAMGYDEEDLMLAIEGHAADPMQWAPNEEARRAFRDLDWMMAREKRIEAAMERGDELRAKLADHENRASMAAASPVQPAAPSPTPEQVAEQRRKLREMAASMAGRRA